MRSLKLIIVFIFAVLLENCYAQRCPNCVLINGVPDFNLLWRDFSNPGLLGTCPTGQSLTNFSLSSGPNFIGSRCCCSSVTLTTTTTTTTTPRPTTTTTTPTPRPTTTTTTPTPTTTTLPPPSPFERNTIFSFFKSSDPTTRIISNFSTSIESQGCNPNENFTMIVHGWLEGNRTAWVNNTVTNFLTHRGGCVFFFDYSFYSNNSNYFALTPFFRDLSAVLLKKFRQIENYDRQYCYGFSFGARLCSDAGTKLGNQLIARMDLCEPAGPGFDNNIDPKPAAKNVACINTSTDKGTSNYNCHQNFRMGSCGNWQIAAGPYPLGSHGLCPYFFNLSFNYDFVPVNTYRCTSNRLAPNITSDVKMGYRAEFNRTLVRGDIFITTARYSPYLVINGVIENQPMRSP